MSNTYKKCPRHSCLRSPRGRRKAIINGTRHGAIPPDPWDDINHCKITWMPYRVANKMKKEKNWTIEKMIHKLMHKFNLSYNDARYFVE